MKRLLSGITAIAVLSMAMSMPINRLEAYAETESILCINEVMASNKSSIRDGDLQEPKYGSEGGAYSDWVEIYNSSSKAVDLTDYTLSDDSFSWKFPQGIVPAKGYLLVWASDKNKVTQDGQLHCNFKISASGETLTLKNTTGAVIDYVEIPSLSDDNSFGRLSDAATDFTIFLKSTPGSANINGTSYVNEPVFSHEAGFYADAFKLKLSTNEANAKIYYTTDGTDPIPGKGGTREYTDGIEIKQLQNDTNSLLKCSTIKAVTVKSGEASSKIITRSYFVNPDIKDKYDLPVVSLVTDPANFFDPEKGIYVEQNVQNKGSEWERPIHVEFFENDGSLGFSKYCGVRINGETTRLMIPQQSLRLYADRDYEDSKKIKYNIFPELKDKVSDKEITSFKRLILRNSGSDWTRTMFRDALVHSLASDINLDTQAYRPCVAFLNGEYWGIYNIRERYDNIYFESHYDLDKDNVALLEFSFDFAFDGEIEVDEGTE
ncbi:MAG: CotH protein [Firmicutes bacterium ADurb.Bin419]|nr:MAG: CotH protein [Firmicutes bacterium ADurb.Bin419]